MARALPLDYSRCTNFDCPVKTECLRWIDNNHGRIFSVFKSTTTGCENKIEPKEYFERFQQTKIKK